MSVVVRRYIAVETAISMAINTGFSALFMWLAFGRTAWIDLWGAHGLALDFVPQTFMIAAMSVLVPGALARQRIRERRIEGCVAQTPGRWPHHLWLRTLLMAAVLTVVLGGIASGALAAAWHGPLGFWTVFPLKLAYGAFVALVATPLGLRVALSEK
jgi:hypothetical protein